MPECFTWNISLWKMGDVSRGTFLFPNTEIGKNCIINNKVLIEHDVAVGDHCHIATGAIVNGEVSVGSESFIGSGSISKQSIAIGNNLSLIHI